MLVEIDAYTLLFPLLAAVLWYTTERKALSLKVFGKGEETQAEELLEHMVMGSEVSMNLKCKFSLPLLLAKLRHSHPLLVVLSISVLYYLCLFSARGSIQLMAHAFTFSLYLFLVVASVIAIQTHPSNFGSSLVVLMLTTVHAAEFLTCIILPEGRVLSTIQALLDSWGYFLFIYAIALICSEYFPEVQSAQQDDLEAQLGELIGEVKGKQFLLSTSLPFAVLFRHALKSSSEKPKPEVVAGHSLRTLETLSIGLLLSCALAMSMLVIFPDWEEPSPWVTLGFEVSMWLSVLMGIVVLVLDACKIFTRGPSEALNGDVCWLMAGIILGGALFRVFVDIGSIVSVFGHLQQYSPHHTSTHGFSSYGKETFALIIPLAFHFFHVFNAKRESLSATITKWTFYTFLLNLHFAVIGLVLEAAAASFLLSFLRAFTLLAAIDLCVLVGLALAPWLRYLNARPEKLLVEEK